MGNTLRFKIKLRTKNLLNGILRDIRQKKVIVNRAEKSGTKNISKKSFFFSDFILGLNRLVILHLLVNIKKN